MGLGLERQRIGFNTLPAGLDGPQIRQNPGFMSTERRDCPGWLQARMESAQALSRIWLGLFALFIRAAAMGRTASPESPARLATNSLDSDYRNTMHVRHLLTDLRRGSPPGAHFATAAGTSVSRVFSRFARPVSALFEDFRLALP